VDNAMQRVVEILVGIPSLVVAIRSDDSLFRPGILTITIAIGITGWVYTKPRIVRGRMMQLKNQEFALAGPGG